MEIKSYKEKSIQDTETDEKKLLTYLFLSSVIISFLFGVFVYVMLRNVRRIKYDDIKYDYSISSSDTEIMNLQFEPIKKVAYVLDDKVFVYDMEKGKEIEFTANVNVSSLAWKNSENVSFSNCESNYCTIFLYDLRLKEFEEVVKVETENIKDHRWAHSGDILAYSFEKEDKFYLTLKKGDLIKNVGSFDFIGDKERDFNDALYIRFSPDDQKVMLVNTFINESPILIFDVKGNKLDEIKNVENDNVSFAFFTSNETIYYKRGEYLFVKTVGVENETKVSDRIVGAFGFNPSYNRTKISYWTYDWKGGITTIWTFEFGTNEIKRIRDYESFPVWIDNDNLVSFSTPYCSECHLSKFKFDGLSKGRISTKVFTKVVNSDSIKLFCAENI